MRRITSALLAAVAVLALTAGSAFGAVNSKGGLPTATFNGASVTVSGGDFSGLGNTPAFAVLTVNGEATYVCTNNGGNAAPGQNPVAAQGGTSDPVQLSTAKNGRSTVPPITQSVSAPTTAPTAQQVGCGGKGSESWDVTLTGLRATTANLTITHGGSTLLCRNYSVNGPATGTAC